MAARALKAKRAGKYVNFKGKNLKKGTAKVKQLNDSEYSFIVMDEIFSSTNHIEGSSGAYAILKSLSKYKNNITIITTHYESLTKLEKKKKKRFINYKFEINRDNNGDIIYDGDNITNSDIHVRYDGEENNNDGDYLSEITM